MKFVPLALSLLFLLSCSHKYPVQKNQYQFKSEKGVPDYSNLDYWAAHPSKNDPSDSVPAPLHIEFRDTAADVFFLHPTTYTGKNEMTPNAPIDESDINKKTDYTSILYQASVFNQHARVFAPRYRQAHIRTFYAADKQKAATAFEIAYNDIRESFIYYLQHWNHDRPVIIAAHSQGSLLAIRLIKEFFDNTALQDKLIVAYIIGWPVFENDFTSIPVCEDSLQTGCFVSWRTYREGYIPEYIQKESRTAAVINPLTWTRDPGFISRKYNKGSLLKDFNKIYFNTTDAEVHKGVLHTRKPGFPWSFLFFTKNYHVGDINLYYLNIRENVEQRIRSYQNKN